MSSLTEYYTTSSSLDTSSSFESVSTPEPVSMPEPISTPEFDTTAKPVSTPELISPGPRLSVTQHHPEISPVIGCQTRLEVVVADVSLPILHGLSKLEEPTMLIFARYPNQSW